MALPTTKAITHGGTLDDLVFIFQWPPSLIARHCRPFLKMRLVIPIVLISMINVYGQDVRKDSCYSILDTLTHQEVFKFADKTFEVVGGMDQLTKELSERMKYPHIDKYPTERKVLVGFIINEDGRLTGKRIIKDFRGYGEQLLDILDDFTWEPGVCRGKKVATLQLFPLTFKL